MISTGIVTFLCPQTHKKEKTTGPTDVKWAVREYHKQLCAKKFDNPGEMDKFLERCKLPQLM